MRFDGAYSPLLELDYGQGRLTLCLLDLEGRTAQEPAADRLARTLLRYARTAPLGRARRTWFCSAPRPPGSTCWGWRWKGPTRSPRRVWCWSLPTPPWSSRPSPSSPRGAARSSSSRAGPRRPRWASLSRSVPARALSGARWDLAAGLSPSDLRWRTETTAGLAKAGAEIGAGGQLARRRTSARGCSVSAAARPGPFRGRPADLLPLHPLGGRPAPLCKCWPTWAPPCAPTPSPLVPPARLSPASTIPIIASTSTSVTIRSGIGGGSAPSGGRRPSRESAPDTETTG